jgi:hypothetical protein
MREKDCNLGKFSGNHFGVMGGLVRAIYAVMPRTAPLAIGSACVLS